VPIPVTCPSCGKKLQAPDAAAGKQARCPSCASLMTVPEPVHEAEEVGPDFGIGEPSGPSGGVGGLLDELDAQSAAAGPAVPWTPAPARAPAPAGPVGEPRRPCPMCGEMILASAVKCRYCGEVFDPTLKRKEAKARRYSSSDEDLSTADWLLAILCSGIGCIIGVVWLIQGKPKAGKMIGVSVLCAILWNVVRFAIEMAARAH
jgi:predicted RNA-binding Zn-ribbon protein involved in translation (DUF1610 family)